MDKLKLMLADLDRMQRQSRIPVCPECCAKMLPLLQKDFEDHIPERAWYCPNQGEAFHAEMVAKMERDHAAARDQEEASA